MVEASIGSLQFPHNISNLISEHGTVDKERRHEDFENQFSDDSDIQMVDRRIEDSSIHTKAVEHVVSLNA